MTDSLRAQTIHVTGHGGDDIEAYVAIPDADGPRGGVVVIHHMPGYDRATKEMVCRFAMMGFNAICPNLHYREAPGTPPDDAAAATRAAGGVPDDRLVGDVDAVADYLRGLESSNGRVGVIGHCSGGRQSFLAACRLQLDAAVDCYGAFIVAAPGPQMPLKVQPILDLAPHLSCPLLGLFGAEDSYPTPAETAELEAELTRLGKTFDFHTYEGAGHAFFAVDRPSYRVEAANDGWQRIEAWYKRYLAGSAASGG